jgi:hypothetical protein
MKLEGSAAHEPLQPSRQLVISALLCTFQKWSFRARSGDDALIDHCFLRRVRDEK